MNVSEKKSLELESLVSAVDINENKVILDIMANKEICKKNYNNYHRTVADNLTEVLAYCPMMQLDDMSEGMKHNSWDILI